MSAAAAGAGGADAAADARRIDGVDFVKAAAIVAVVATHSGVYVFSPAATAWDRILTSTWTWFHVPAFLLVSGFLYRSAAPVAASTVARRLLRVLVPYLLASLFLQATGLARVASLRDALVQIATASAVSHYYFVALLTGCILCVWPLSRLPRGGPAWLLAGLAAYAALLAFRPELRVTRDPFWLVRNPLEGFCLGFFVLGWLAAAHRAGLAALLERRRGLVTGVAFVGAALWFASIGRVIAPDVVTLLRVEYTLCAVALILAASRGRRAPPAVRFLSSTTLAIYLFHIAPLLTTYAIVKPWPAPLRIAFQLALGLGAGCALAWLARRLLGGGLARRLVGA